MRVLYITDNLLDNNGGGNIATSAFINAFSEIANKCQVLYPDKGQKIANYLHKKTILKGVPDKKSKVKKLIEIYSGRISRYVNVLQFDVESYKPDIVVFDGSRSSCGLIKRLKSQGGKIITIHHNYEIEYYKGTPPSILWRIPFMHYMKKAERSAVQYSDLNLTLTNEDKELLRLNYDPDTKAKIEKWGSFESIQSEKATDELNHYQFGNQKRRDYKELKFVITGSLSSRQTQISLIPFLKKIYPLLANKLPNSKLVIAGRNPSNKLKKVSSKYPSIALVPDPENMQMIVNQADVYICPTCVGGGMKLRIRDGLKAGLPVLAHVVSARGYDDFIKAGYLFTYRDQISFMQSLEHLLSELKNGKIKKTDIQDIYDSIFSFESGVNRLREFLKR